MILEWLLTHKLALEMRPALALTGMVSKEIAVPRRKSLWIALGVLSLLAIMIAEIAFSVRQESLTWDEGDHLYAGYMSLKEHDYSLNPEHPPMAKMVAALPLLPLDLKHARVPNPDFKGMAYYSGREMLFRNGPANGGKYDADTLIFRAHMAIMIFMLLLAVLTFFAGWEMFGLGAGFIAMARVVFEPSMLTNAPYVTTDSAASCMFFATVFAFYRYVKAPSILRLALTGLAAGLALAAKHSAILLLPMLVLLIVGELVGRWWMEHSGEGSLKPSIGKQSLRLAGALAVIVMIAVTVLWSFYGFRYGMRPDGSAMEPSMASTAAGLKPFVGGAILHLANWHVLPESYLYGLIDVQRVANWMPSYIFGKLHAHGVWYYFPVVLALKFTLGAMGLLAITLWALVKGKLRRWREVWFLMVPVAVYLTVAMSSPLNIGVRHILPTFAFLLTLAAGGAWTMVRQDRRWGYAVAVLLLAHVVSSARMFPNYMPYANELWGGPSHTHEYLSDSATDWGQELKWTKTYLDRHAIKECWFAYFPAPFLLPSDYGVPCKLLPTLDTLYEMDIDVPPVIHGPVLISYADLNGFEFGTKVRNPYQSFFERKPDAVIMNGIAVFNGDFAVPQLAAITQAKKAQVLLEKKDYANALREAMTALSFDSKCFDGQLVAGDALHALGRDAEAREHFNRGMELVGTMEPSSQKEWKPQIDKRLAELHVN
jgi:hypothetical protein